MTVGRKGRDYLRREYASRLVGEFSFAGKKRVEFSDVNEVATRIAVDAGRRASSTSARSSTTASYR